MGYEIPTARELAKLGNLELTAKYNEIAAQFPEGEQPKRIARFESRERGVERVRELIKRLRLAEGQLSLIATPPPVNVHDAVGVDVLTAPMPKIPTRAEDPEIGKTWECGGDLPPSEPGLIGEVPPQSFDVPKVVERLRRRSSPPVDRKGDAISLLPCRAGSMAATLVDLLSRPEGATLDELATATNSTVDEVRSKGLCWWLPYHGYGSRKQGESYYLVVPHNQGIPEHVA